MSPGLTPQNPYFEQQTLSGHFSLVDHCEPLVPDINLGVCGQILSLELLTILDHTRTLSRSQKYNFGMSNR